MTTFSRKVSQPNNPQRQERILCQVMWDLKGSVDIVLMTVLSPDFETDHDRYSKTFCCGNKTERHQISSPTLQPQIF